MITIGKKSIGDDYPCFITFEAGPTHNGFEQAKRLVSHAAEAKADAVKFQILDPDRLVADKKQLFSYEILIDSKTGRTETVAEPLYDILCRRSLTPDEWKALKRYCDSKDLLFFATVGFEEEIELLKSMDCDSIKIASADVNYTPFIRKAAKTGMCVQLDTGNANIGEIEEAVDTIVSEGNNRIIIHNCPSGYPARLESINLKLIKTLKQLFPYPVAFSDHTPGRDMDIAAIAMGANLVEKTITEDRMTRSVEHIFSLEPADMKAFVESIREVEVALGTPRRILHPAELEKRLAIRRSAYLKKSVKKGDRLESAEYEFRRPGYGVAPNELEKMMHHVFTRDLPRNHMLAIDDIG